MIRAFSRSRRLVGPLIAALVAMSLPATAVAVTVGTTTTFSITPNPWSYCTGATWSSTVTADGPADGSNPYGTVTFYDVTGGGHIQVAQGTLSSGSSVVSIPGYTCLTIGSHDVQAEFTSSNPAYANSTSSPPYTIVVGAGPSGITMSGPTTVEQHSDAYLTMDLSAGHDVTGTLALYRQGSATPICTMPGTHSQGAGLPSCQISTATAGSFSYYATWTSDDTGTVLSSQSALYPVTITADTVHAHGVAVQYTSIYPTTDGYRDTDRLSGARDELLTTSIKIYNAANTLVRSVTIAAGVGAYSYLWNGRNSSGTILAEGTYKVVTKFTDAYANTKTYNNSIVLSKKHLIWHTSSVSRLGSSVSATGHTGSGTVTVNTTSHYARLYAPGIYSSWAGAGWQLTLPTAVSYRYISLRVYAKEHFMAGQDISVGAQNFSTCGYSATYWDESCFDTWHPVGNIAGTTAWYSTGGVTSSHRYGRTVRVMVSAWGSVTYVYTAQVTFQYSTLGY